MRHIVFGQSTSYPVAILMKHTSFNQRDIEATYVRPLEARGIAREDLIAVTLAYDDKGKAPVKFIKAYLETLLPDLVCLGTTTLLVTDSNYFKVLTKSAKAEPHHGYVLPCAIKGFEHLHVVLSVNYQALIYNPDLQAKIDMSIQALADHVQDVYTPLGSNIIHTAQYPKTVEDIAQALQDLHQYDTLTCDIETFSLRFEKAGIGTIAFAWDEHNGLAFTCDYDAECLEDGYQIGIGKQVHNQPVRDLIKQFLSTYQGTLIFHNATFDVKVLIAQLWMANPLNLAGQLRGLEILTRKIHDTKIIAYLATNSTAGNVLGLKSLAHEFAGNWAVDEISDIRRTPLRDLLQYNLVDCLSTWYVYKKYWPIMVADRQLSIYQEIMLPSLKSIIHMELNGMPMSAYDIQRVKTQMQAKQEEHLKVIRDSPIIKMLNLLLQESAMEAANAKLKKKVRPLEDFAGTVFNPNSGPQLQRLLYEQMGLPVIDLTDTKQPATGAETIEKLINHTTNPAYKEILAALIGYGKVTKILSTFIPAFEAGLVKDDGRKYLHGSFNLGGTVSGRLSSSSPNMQNIPAGSEYAAWIKECFQAPPGWLFCGADFNSLEDYISALTTKDPNKLDVYIRGYDGHCLRAAYYFRDQLSHIDLDDPGSVNSIKQTHPQLRQDSKAPTFLLTYGGTYHGMMNNLGWPEAMARQIEANYHDLYKVSDQYVQDRLRQANRDGYVEVAFGLRVRTPLLKQVVWGTRIPYEAQAEGRTAGNALGQSYGLLNNRAANAFMQKVWDSPYRHDIKLVALIHDAIYILVRDDIDVVEWTNRELIKAMQWQELPEIQHPTVKLGAALDIFWPHWGSPLTLPNNADRATIEALSLAHRNKVLEAA